MSELHSYHIFLFPFKWKIANSSLEKFEETLIDKNHWNANCRFSIKSLEDYNEYNYFYDFAREIMYDLDKEMQAESRIEKNMMRHFEHKKAKGGKYIIHCNSKRYELEIESVMLNVYDTGVGVLSFHLANREYAGFEDILHINQYGRRIFMPSFAYNLQEVDVPNNEQTDFDRGRNEITFLMPTYIELINEQQGFHLSENFQDYKNVGNFKHEPFLIPQFIKGLFGNKQNNLLPLYNKLKRETDKVCIYPVLDDRMFTICWYGNDQASNELVAKKRERHSTKLVYEESDKWYKFLFVDTSLTCQNTPMLAEQIKNQTYTRWSGYGSLFGVSRYSFVLLTQAIPSLKRNNVSFLLKHIQGIYYKMTELCLVQRASVLAFSDEVTEVSEQIKDGNAQNIEKITEEISDLYKNYIRFVNKIYFREVTAQEQGIEIYDLMQKILRIPEQVKDLDNEIGELHNYASIQEDKKLTHIATRFLPAGFLAALISIIITLVTASSPSLDNRILIGIGISIFLLLSIYGYRFILKLLNLKLWKSSKK